MYSDNFCSIADMGCKKAFYCDRSGNYFVMSLRWAEKIVLLFREGNMERACHYIDMAEGRECK